MATKDEIYNRMVAMLDRIHLQIENGVQDIELMFDEIGYLIAEARGEYDQEDGTSGQDRDSYSDDQDRESYSAG